MTQGHCPTPQTSPTYIAMSAKAVPAKPHQVKIQGILPDKRRTPCGWPTCLKKQPPRVAFRNNDIYMVNGEESDPFPTSKNMPHREDFDDDNYESIEEKETAV